MSALPTQRRRRFLPHPLACVRVQGHWIVTLFLVNSQREPRLLADRALLFQQGAGTSGSPC
jgi:hypothetical protein